MLSITVEVNAPGWMAQGVKESLAMYLERFGDARVVDVDEWDPEEYKQIAAKAREKHADGYKQGILPGC